MQTHAYLNLNLYNLVNNEQCQYHKTQQSPLLTTLRLYQLLSPKLSDSSSSLTPQRELREERHEDAP